MTYPTKEQFVDTVKKFAENIYEFHERWQFGPFNPQFQLGAGIQTTIPGLESRKKIMQERMPLISEEYEEVIEELKQLVSHDKLGSDLSDELADLLYVVLGTIHSLSMYGIYGMEEIMTKNNNKTPETHAVRKDTGKLIPLDRIEKWQGALVQHAEELKKRERVS